ncbi:chemotaxis protein CheA [Acetanaerobacterium elongatum]|uniref:Chemotaxis protein CheA n=1 Tax=Acetanaerobacterium elongatum TaxID=258515 RepID=A0A1G9ZDL7_9FIRM|nr:chemotaxis protein CheA [Acetanaerobacterium elongatum]SDN19314.1 two-component system, chemotaxis family, sensor kinase CheA [Acetanaerobacterium elongatum]
MDKFDMSLESMLETFIFESNTLLEQLDAILLKSEKSNDMEQEDINEIFRIMHTIKGSAAMMGIENVSTVAHRIEDLFFIIRENKSATADYSSIYDIVFQGSDFIKSEIESIQDETTKAADPEELIGRIQEEIDFIKGGTAQKKAKPAAKQKANKPVVKEETEAAGQEPTVVEDSAAEQTAVAEELPEKEDNGKAETVVRVFFEDGCKMENIRAFMLINNMKDYCEKLTYEPQDIETDQNTAKQIVESGFIISFVPFNGNDEIYKIIETSLYIKSYEVLSDGAAVVEETKAAAAAQQETAEKQAAAIENVNTAVQQSKSVKQNLISVNLNKLDELMDLVGELVITESMVIANPDLKGMQLENFTKASRQLRKLTDELQDIVMSIRMVPVSGVFNKMNRIVRDMSKKLNKEVELELIGEDTEVDKTIIDSLGDPLMHLIRNAMDHGLEVTEDRIKKGKSPVGKVILSAENTAGEVVIRVSDDGAGINPSKILKKARANGLLTKNDADYTEKEIYNMIMLPGFSTNTEVTEFSGRGVGMDVARKNIEKVGGSISIESKLDKGTTFIIKIPLTLAIVDGMEVSVGGSILTIPITSIRESFKIQPKQIVKDVNGTEMIMIRGECYPVIRIFEAFGIDTKITNVLDGIIILVETEDKAVCLLADQLIGEQQVVVKPLPNYLNRFNVKERGVAGCTILGDGSISLILDIKNLIANN